MSFVSGVSTYTAAKFVRWKMDHNLGKDETTGIHPSLSETPKSIVEAPPVSDPISNRKRLY
jgi:hypothetical protein